MQNGLAVRERDFFKNPLSKLEMDNLLKGRSAFDMFNFRSPSFKKLKVDREKLSETDLVALMLAQPRLIRRPVVKIGSNVHFGASAKTLADLLG